MASGSGRGGGGNDGEYEYEYAESGGTSGANGQGNEGKDGGRTVATGTGTRQTGFGGRKSKGKRRRKRAPRCKLLVKRRGHLIPESVEAAEVAAEYCLVCQEWVARNKLATAQMARLTRLEAELEMEHTRAEESIVAYESQIAELTETVKTHRQAQMQSRSELDKLHVHCEDLQAELDEAKNTLVVVREEAKEASAKRVAAEASASNLWSRLTQANHERDLSKNELKSTNKALGESRKALKTAIEQLNAAKDENDNLRANVQALESKITRMRVAIEKVKAQRKLEADIHAKELQELHSVGVRRMMYGSSSSYKPAQPSKDASLAFQIALSKIDRHVSPHDPQVGVDDPDEVDLY
ncbi:uncharacterized protein AMSG_05869 [Thecamonas trahens ATCC 50062]|uniref:Uncharacterized protein n=1 Tax=Thecamonas trahens ATCC 50062 TaxID=461836 RepID=A0A0L0DFL8_THETB|nr:hypothetical protein AMSG_05869 [Thecamonas trahens ATCC 50062]KNC50098.1 hypothetical protein AMSG_05869 [Thecamonas trahens ATCC 50062]|eukprot:XP_013757258.1 hypothetical protein AMSG_05869 [Thecamonas trahens ATCC 50062]